MYSLCYKETLNCISYFGLLLSFIAYLFKKMSENHEGGIMITCHVPFPGILSVKNKGIVITCGGKYSTMKQINEGKVGSSQMVSN
jgi:hypothetical protein